MDKDRTPNISKNTIAINITKEKNNALDTCPSFQSMENSIRSNLNHTSPSATKWTSNYQQKYRNKSLDSHFAAALNSSSKTLLCELYEIWRTLLHLQTFLFKTKSVNLKSLGKCNILSTQKEDRKASLHHKHQDDG